MTMLRPAILLFILLSLITGGLYPLVTTALGQWWFKDQANGSLIVQNGENRGSRLIGQNFTDARYFQGRPSATAESPYNPMASGGSNLAGSNPELDKAIAERVAALRAANPQASREVPVELGDGLCKRAGLQPDAEGGGMADPPRRGGPSADGGTGEQAGRRAYAKTAGQLHRHARGEYC